MMQLGEEFIHTKDGSYMLIDNGEVDYGSEILLSISDEFVKKEIINFNTERSYIIKYAIDIGIYSSFVDTFKYNLA